MISKKQHTALAQAFCAYFEKIYDGMRSPAMCVVAYAQWQPILGRVCHVLENDNPAFDRRQFLQDCGVRREGG